MAEPTLLVRLLRLAAACGLATALLFTGLACDLTSGGDARDPGSDSREGGGGDGDEGDDGADGEDGGDGDDGGEDGDGGDEGDDGDGDEDGGGDD